MAGFIFLAIYIAVIFIRPQEIGNPNATFPIVKYLTLTTMGLWLMFHKEKVFSPQLKALFLFCIVMSFSSVLNGWAGGAITVLTKFIPAAILPMIIVSNLITTLKRQHIIMTICLIAALCMVHNGYYQLQHPEGIGWTGTSSVGANRITYLGNFGDPNDLGMFLVMTLPFAVYFRANSGAVFKHIATGVIISILYGVLITNSRGALLGVLSLVALYFLLKWGWKKTMSVGVLSLPVLGVVMSQFRTIEQGESANGRVEAWYQGFQMLKSGPFFGVGQGNFTEFNSHTAHNSYILVLSELGIFGYILWCVVLFTTIYMLYKIMVFGKNHPDIKSLSLTAQREIMLSKTLIFSMAGFMTTAFFLSRSYSILFFVFCGIGIASYYRAIKIIPEVEITDFKPFLQKVCKFSLYSVVFLYIITRILL